MRFSAFDWYVEHTLGLRTEFVPVAPEEQNSDYEAGNAPVSGQRWRLRTARVTPTKAGAFVAVWRRSEQGATEPFPADEEIAGLAVFVVEEDQRRGLFWFTAAHLRELGITSSQGHPGKRGFRVYPEWCTGLNRQASRTQAAQAPAFVRLGATSGS
ncbi:MAG: MepB family protein [Arthrobacter sp.]|uniref:MepB family protein n=1 Tax=unclassified Arthrobacter TaxID=235627 RepID=UPI00265133D2|nr:MepB family protein [Micrococcaceae bacterium]MDN5812963.1 MepB family protein [Micrococcaceae bacterium]MDN5823327.1 MepB family protein [Micrococcaceae bacterium]MDN5880003.1 MepB family protein [Micrococcaceae bacterium]MDN5886461.1 MepB family protein [Micrococcaceae bacterium]